MTVVFDAGQNSAANFAHLAAAGLALRRVDPPVGLPDLLAFPPGDDRHIVDPDRFPGLTALEDPPQRLRHRPARRAHPLARPCTPPRPAASTRPWPRPTAKLSELADTLARGHTRRARDKSPPRSPHITDQPWVRRVVTWQLTGDTPAEHRLTSTSTTAPAPTWKTEVFGKRVLITDRDDWSIADVVAGYRSQSEAEFGFRQLKDPHVVSFSPMHHWTEHNIRVHVFTCVLALQIAHLMRRQAHRHGLHLSVRELLDTLAGIQETVLIYPSTGGRPKARRMLTETTTTQDQLVEIFELHRWAPHLRSYTDQPQQKP